MNRVLLVSLLGLASATAAAGSVQSQQLDRSKRPGAASAPAVIAPVIVKRTLPNGLQVWSVTRRQLPIVNALLLIRAGSAVDGATAGVADVTASLLDDGAGGRSALEFANAVDFLGANLNANAGDEQTQISLLTLKKQADSAFALMGDMVVRPAFADEELSRERRARLQALRSQKDRPTIIATQTFNRLVYGADHPYGHPSNGTPATIEKLTRADVSGFYDAYYRPNNAVLIVVGDVSAAEAQALATRAFGSWKSKPVPALAAAIPARPAPRATGVYLVDKPGAAQSEIRIGHALTSRSTSPDYYALRVLNAALGGAFTSRVNLNIREAKGYTYGARTTMTFERGAGPFIASAGVFTAKTDSSLIEFMKEIRDIRGPRPLTAAETEFAKASLVRAYPRALETNAGVAATLADLAFYRLPDTELTGYLAKLEQVKPADVTRVAERYLAPDSSVVVVVGDLAKIQPGIEALHLGPVTVLDPDGLAAR
jgi:predicted Zn-dependent peptidase